MHTCPVRGNVFLETREKSPLPAITPLTASPVGVKLRYFSDKIDTRANAREKASTTIIQILLR